jgi:hypothetical protein
MIFYNSKTKQLVIYPIGILAILLWIALFLSILPKNGYPKNWDMDAAQTEAGKIRSEYLSKAGTLPSYRYSEETGKSEPTGETYHANCCGEADAYEADDVFIDAEGSTWAVLTCNDPDDCKEVQGKEVRQPGTKIKVPQDRVLLNYEPPNFTGHGWIYLSPNSGDNPAVYCYAAPAGF